MARAERNTRETSIGRHSCLGEKKASASRSPGDARWWIYLSICLFCLGAPPALASCLRQKQLSVVEDSKSKHVHSWRQSSTACRKESGQGSQPAGEGCLHNERLLGSTSCGCQTCLFRTKDTKLGRGRQGKARHGSVSLSPPAPVLRVLSSAKLSRIMLSHPRTYSLWHYVKCDSRVVQKVY